MSSTPRRTKFDLQKSLWPYGAIAFRGLNFLWNLEWSETNGRWTEMPLTGKPERCGTTFWYFSKFLISIYFDLFITV
jgi:hypothetical protein